VNDAEDAATYTCTTAADTRVSACATGFYKLDGGVGSADTCPQCATVVDAEEGATYTCTSGTDSRVSGCLPGTFRTEGTAGVMDTCTGKAALKMPQMMPPPPPPPPPPR
jgi:hypothetical protein